MTGLDRQDDANQTLEAGMFFPTGHIVAGFADPSRAREARGGLQQQGFTDDELMYVPAEEMARVAARNLEDPSFFASAGSTMLARQKQLELAEHGYDFILIRAPEQKDEQRALQALAATPPQYAIKYKRLIIENLMPELPSSSNTTQAPRAA